MLSRLRITLKIFFVVGILIASAHAAESICRDGFTICTWQTDDGLPQNTVTAIAQTRDGYLWVGTLNGLARFDGVRFEQFNTANSPGLQDGRISALHEDAQGRLWIGHGSGDVTLYRAGVFKPAGKTPHDLDGVHGFISDRTGTSWIFRRSGRLESITSGHVLNSSRIPEPASILGLVQDSDQATWIMVDGALSRLSKEGLEPVELGAASLSGFVLGIGKARDGGVWVARDGKLRVWADGSWSTQRETYSWSSTGSISQVVERKAGGLAIGTVDQGLMLYFKDGRKLTFDYQNSSIQNWTRVVYEDREGNLWIGAGSGGLTVVRASGLAMLNAPDNWQGRTAISVAEGPDQSLWIGTEGAGLYRWDGEQWMHFGTEEGLRNLYVWALRADSNGDMLAGTWGDGLYQIGKDGSATVADPSLINTHVVALRYTTEDATEWIGTESGVLRVRDGKRTWLREADRSETFVVAVERDNQGVVWLALPDRGLGRVDGDQLTILGRRDGLSSDSAQCLLADGDSIWIGTREGGLNRLRNGRFSLIDKTHGLVSNVICHLADDQRGNIWISTHHGVMRVAKEELHRCANGESDTITGRVFDRADGLPTLGFSGGLQSAGCRTSDGRLWFTSSKGVLVVDPAAIETKREPPPVVIESLIVDGRVVARDAPGAVIRLPPAHHRLGFQYTAMTLTGSSKVQFKHRLIGLDHDWIEAGSKRTADYSQLPRGNYRFQVIACNEDGVWNTEGATLSFTVLPFYWQTWWFLGVSGLLTLSVVVVIVRTVTRRRMQARVRQLEFERGIEQERARIAQDIHDDIGSNLTRISMLSQSLHLRENSPPPAYALLERIRGAALDVTTALDEIVWAVNPQHDSLDSVVSFLAKFAQEALSSADIRCRLDIPMNLPAWALNTQTRHNLILAFKEALNNALKHAGASEVNLSVALRPDGFTVVLQDNGRGFALPSGASPKVSPGRHGNGLGNMRRRLQQIGGHYEIHSQPFGGTRVAFFVPHRGADPLPP